jgi:hypothetical protein
LESVAKGHRYLVDNVREALSEPGQWYLDRPLGRLTYIPKAGEQPDQAEVIAPRLEQVLVLRGDLASKRWVQHVQFSGLTFAHTNWTLPPAGQAFPQAEIGLNAAIVAIGARQIVFERCAVRHVGGWTWGYGHSDAHHNDIGFNHVHTIGQRVTSDMWGSTRLAFSPAPLCTTTMSMTSSRSTMEAGVCTRMKVRPTS